ncbi:MAG TPA: T9SS type A sorting domain-containing protein [Flavobacterium sp.]
MIKNYFFLILSILFSLPSAAQLNANDDSATINGLTGGSLNTRGNDTFNGNLISSCSLVNLTQISSTYSGLYIGGSCGTVFLTAGAPVGTYTLVYQICLASNSSTCDTATVTITVCNLAPPVLINVADPSCADGNGSVTLTDLPATGIWTITLTEFMDSPITITGTGNTTTISSLPSGSYTFRVTDSAGCTSSNVNATINYVVGIDASTTGVYADTNNDGITSIGDVVTFTISVENLLNCDINNLNILESSLPLPSLPTNLTALGTTSVTYDYVITQNDINNGIVGIYAFVGGNSNAGQVYDKTFAAVDLNLPDGIMINAFADTNNNGVQNPGEPSILGFIQYEINNDGQLHDIYSHYYSALIYESNPANSYDITFIPTDYCGLSYTVAPQSFDNITVANGSGITTYNFIGTSVACTDLGVQLYPLEQARPGLPFQQQVAYSNLGNQVISNGTVAFIHDSTVALTSVAPSGSVATPTGFTYNFTNLQPHETRYLDITMQVPALPIVQLGDLIINSVSVSGATGDANAANDADTFTQNVANSYDPNDISESHGPQIVHSAFDTNEYLQYIIRFENIGTANAINISIDNTLDPQLNGSSLRMVAASHPYILEKIGNDLNFKFNNIQLPPSVPDSNIGKGFIVYEVKVNSGFAVGDIIPNVAQIYFDTNPAIVTNTWTSEFVNALDIANSTSTNFVLYPNPTQNVINIIGKDGLIIDDVKLYDVTGKLVLATATSANEAVVNLTDLARGLYLAKIKSNDLEQTVKVVKE